MCRTVLLLTLVLVTIVLSEDSVKTRVKRGKYYSYPPRFYRKPPPPHQIKGAFSYTPPPFMAHDDHPYRPKVSKRPPNDGLDDTDINNLVKHLSKKDLDKIIEFAGEKDKYREDSSERHEYSRPYKRPERTVYRDDDSFANGPFNNDDERSYKVDYSEPPSYVTARPKIYATPPTHPDFLEKNLNSDLSQTKIVYSTLPEKPNTKIVYVNAVESTPEPELTNTKIVYVNQASPVISEPAKVVYVNPQTIPTNTQSIPNQYMNFNQQFSNLQNNVPNQYVNINDQFSNLQSNVIYSNAPSETQESKYNQFSYVTPPTNFVTQNYLYTNSSIMQEEALPRPLNLREDIEDQDYEVSHTNYVPVVSSESYKVESFKDLPLMNYHNSKLHTVDSYKVPHYTVTSTQPQTGRQTTLASKPSYPGASISISVERAPPGATGSDQSDAHLKAVKIWTHHSLGAAYTLHDDGTLSAERPRHKASYGYA